MATYVISDIHSCYSKFKRSIPGDARKLILLGDCFNKGREQKEMFAWVMKNRHNKKYVFVLGNAEVRMNNEVVRHFAPTQNKLYYDWFGTHDGYKNKNIANVVIELIEEGKYKFEDFIDLTHKCYKWYHEEGNWIMAHASWQPGKSPKAQNKLNLVYDVDNFLTKLKKSDYQPQINSMYKDKKFIFGHTPVEAIAKVDNPPVILKEKFFFIDNGIFRTKNPIFYLKIGK